MRLFWEVVPVAYKVAEILWIFAQHVAYLTTSIRCVLSSLDPSIGCLLQNKKMFLVKRVELTPRQMKAKLAAYLFDPH